MRCRFYAWLIRLLLYHKPQNVLYQVSYFDDTGLLLLRTQCRFEPSSAIRRQTGREDPQPFPPCNVVHNGINPVFETLVLLFQPDE